MFLRDLFADRHNNITYDLDDIRKQVGTITYFNSQNNLNSVKIFSIKINKLVAPSFVFWEIVSFRKKNIFKATKKCAFVNFMTFVCLHINKFCVNYSGVQTKIP